MTLDPLDIPDYLKIPQDVRKKAWENVKLTNQWTGETEETWKKRQNELMAAREEADRAAEARKREKEHPGQYWDPCERAWVKRVTAPVREVAGVAGWTCPSLQTMCSLASCDGGAACMVAGAA